MRVQCCESFAKKPVLDCEAAKLLEWNSGTLSRLETNEMGLSLSELEEFAGVVKCEREAMVFRCFETMLAKNKNETAKALMRLLRDAKVRSAKR